MKVGLLNVAVVAFVLFVAGVAIGALMRETHEPYLKHPPRSDWQTLYMGLDRAASRSAWDGEWFMARGEPPTRVDTIEDLAEAFPDSVVNLDDMV